MDGVNWILKQIAFRLIFFTNFSISVKVTLTIFGNQSCLLYGCDSLLISEHFYEQGFKGRGDGI